MGLLGLYLPFLCLCKSEGIWGGGFRHIHMGYKDFHKCWSGSLAKRRLCFGPSSIINCIPLSALSFWVTLFPGTHGYNIWCMGRETPNFEEISTSWGYSEALWLESSRGGRRLALLEGFRFSTPGTLTLAGSGRHQGNSAQARRNPPGRVEKGAWSPPIFKLVFVSSLLSCKLFF